MSYYRVTAATLFSTVMQYKWTKFFRLYHTLLCAFMNESRTECRAVTQQYRLMHQTKNQLHLSGTADIFM